MTEQLKTLMDRAADLDFGAVDLDAITSDGDRTVRRRRIATGAAGVAALAVIATTAAVLGGDDGSSKTDFVDNPFRSDVPMWTEGSTLHTPDQTYDLGVDVLSFATTSEGVVFMGLEDGGDLGVYALTGGDEPVRIGQTDDPHLSADSDDAYVGWLDRSGADYQAVIFDQSTGDRVWSEPARVEHSFPIVAIDDGRALLADVDEGPTRVLDIETGEITDLPDPTRFEYFFDIEGDLVATLLESRSGRDIGAQVSRLGSAGDRVEIRAEDTGPAVFSPGGRWISVSAEDVSVYDVTTGAPIDIGPLDGVEGYGYQWADADTLMVVAEPADNNEALQLLSCEIPSGACDELAYFDDFEQIFSIGSSDLLWGLVRGDGERGEVTMEASPAEVQSSATERPE